MSSALLLSGSPRPGGNTDDCLGLLAGEFTKAGWEVETIHTRDRNVKPCLGCRACMKLKHCAIRDDDFEGIWERMRQSDLLTMAAPIYWLSPPGHMKAFIDRTHGYFVVPDCLAGLKVGLLSVAADEGCWEPHERIMGCITWFGAELLSNCRILARDKGEALASQENREKLKSWAEELRGTV